MSTLTVRNIASVIKGKLRLMGAAHGHSTQEEMRSHFASVRDADRQAK